MEKLAQNTSFVT